MAIRDPNVLNRVNTLNTNLENNNITEIERNIGTSLFNVLEGPMNISIDPEILASIEQTSRTSDLRNRITAQRGELSTTPVDIPYPTGSVNIANTVVTGTTNNAGETQSRINENQGYIDSLRDDLPNQIRILRTRLEENQRIVNNINRAQGRLQDPARTLTEINTDITEYENLESSSHDLVEILTRINEIERDRDYGTGSRRGNNLNGQRTNNIDRFNDILHDANFPNEILPTGFTPNDFNGATDIASGLISNYRRINTNIVARLRELRNEQTGTNNVQELTNSLSNTRVNIPSYNLGFTDAETVVNDVNVDTVSNSGTELGRIRERLRNLQTLEDNIPRLRTRYQENIDTLRTLLTLQNLSERLQSRYPGEMDRRHNEFDLIRDIAINNLRLRNTGYQSRLHNQTLNIGQTIAPIPLDFVHGTLRAGLTPTYNLCDGTGNPYRIDGGNIEIPLENGTTIRLSGLTFSTTGDLTVNNLRITPLDGITFPLNLNNLNVRVRIHDDATGLDIDHHKPINLRINGPALDVHTEREPAYDSLVPPMNERIEAEYSDNYRENLENEAIWRILREGGNGNEAEVNEIYNNEIRRNLFIDRIRRRLAGNIPFLGLAALQAGFRADMTREDRDVPAQYLLNQNVFQNYLRQSIPDNLRNYASNRISEILNDTAHNNYRDNILNEFLTFQTDVANGKVDNNDNLAVLAQVPGDNDGPQSHPDSWWQRLRRNRSRRNNYTKFFQGRNAELNNQTLETEDGEIKYGVNVEVLGVNRIVATINIDGKDEPEIIEAANHDRLITGILSRAHTKDGEPLNRKLRCNIALSVLKAMVMMSPQRLNREIPLTNFTDARGNTVECDRIEAFVRGENLRIRGGRVDPATHTRQNVIIFDENQFKNLHDINALENCVHTLSTQINSIMNATAQEYQEATNGLLHNWENRNLLKYDTAQRLRGGPIKRLRGKLRHGKTNNDFNFDTSVNEAGKSANITFNNGKFTVSGTFDGQEYNFEAKDLGSILRKKINRKRVFDGIELAMVAAINEGYVNKLRTNNLVQTENFAVADLNENKTGKIYIFDEDGNLSYLEIEDRALNPLGGENSGRIDNDAMPTERIRCNDQERKEFFQNPLLAGRLLREMRRRLALF